MPARSLQHVQGLRGLRRGSRPKRTPQEFQEYLKSIPERTPPKSTPPRVRPQQYAPKGTLKSKSTPSAPKSALSLPYASPEPAMARCL